MSNYIDKTIFRGNGQYNKGVWVLLGIPTADLVSEIENNLGESSCFVAQTKRDEASSKEVFESLKIKDVYIAGFASTSPDFTTDGSGVKLETTSTSAVNISFAPSADSNIFFDVLPSEDKTGISPKCLAYVTLQQNQETKKYPFYYDEINENDVSLVDRSSIIYNNMWHGRTTLADGYDKNSTIVFNEFFDRVLLVYGLNNLSGNISVVNRFNYTGFTVGNANINLSGLDDIFNYSVSTGA
jgi:hypothetical protein